MLHCRLALAFLAVASAGLRPTLGTAEDLRVTDEFPRGLDPQVHATDCFRTMVDKRLKYLRQIGGERLALFYVQEELKDALYLVDNREWWVSQMLEYLREHGDLDSLRVIEKWLSADLLMVRNEQGYIRTTRALATEAWYRIRARLARTPEERKNLARSFLDWDFKTPPLEARPGLVAEVLRDYMPEARAWVYDALRTKRMLDGHADDAVQCVLVGLLMTEPFRPTAAEKGEIMESANQVAKYLVSEAQEYVERYSTKPYRLEALADRSNIYVPLLQMEHVREWIRKGDRAIVERIVALWGWLHTEPRSELVECLRYRIVEAFAVPVLTGSKEVATTVLKEYLTRYPRLKDEDFRSIDDRLRRGKEFASEMVGILYYRAEGRRLAVERLRSWGEAVPHEKQQEKAPDRVPAGHKGEGKADSGPDTASPEGIGSEPRVRWFIDGRELGK